MQKHFIAQNQSRIINCKRCLYLYPDIYPSPFSREYHTGKYWFLNKSKSSNLLIINPAEIAQLVSLERRSLFRPWSSNPCQGWGREFESRFPLHRRDHFRVVSFFVEKGLLRDSFSAPMTVPVQKTPDHPVRRIMSHVIRLGFEPKTHSLEGCCSIQLSYRTEPLSLLILPWKPKWVQR